MGKQSNVVPITLPLNKKKEWGTISQDELYDFYQLGKKYTDYRDRYLAAKAKLILRMNAGARQEAGKFHLERSDRWIRRVSWRSVVVELRSEAFAQAKLDATKKKRSTVLDWADVPRNVR